MELPRNEPPPGRLEPRGQATFRAPPLVLATNQIGAGDPAQLSYAYGRLNNPSWEALEAELGRWEGARALCFASGQAASTALLLALAAERRRVVLPSGGYYGTRALLGLLAPFGIEVCGVDGAELSAWESALDGAPALVWAESPTNPWLDVLDLSALAERAHARGALLVVDNTLATPALQRPLDWGADATVTSLSKGASGHDDVVLGAVATRDDELHRQLAQWRTRAGGIAGPFEAWLALRGLQTLALRLERQSATALELSQTLERARGVRTVHYPGRNPRTAAVAARQMPNGFGPLLSFAIDGDAQAAERVVRAARLIQPATSFGGVGSSWERRARWPMERVPENLIRLSVGLEPAEELAADIERALAAR